MSRNILTVLIFLPLLTLVSCQGNREENKKVQLTVSIIPQKYLVEYIAGSKFDVKAMLPAGSNHETYEPAPRDMEKIAASRIYFALGALDFELAWLERFKTANPAMKVVNTGKGIVMISGHSPQTANNPEKHEHGTDPHTWLSPACMKIQAANICQALTELDSTQATFFKNNLHKFNNLADSADREIRKKLTLSGSKNILIFHPAMAYFCRDYGLTQISIEQDGKEPSSVHMAEIVKSAKQKGIKAIFISKEFDTRNAEAIAREIEGKVVVFDPMAEDWPSNLINLAQLIAEN